MTSCRVRCLFVCALLVSQAGCVAHKLEGTDALTQKATTLNERRLAEPGAELVVTPLSTWAEGAHCFEPMMYVLTLGLIPTHCVRRYHVSDELLGDVDPASLDTDVTVTAMQGWFPALLPVFSGWRYGSGFEDEDKIRAFVVSGEP